MSKIFKISGNFMQYGEWSTPDPSFVGEIVVDDANTFYGYCDELYENRKSETRFLVGAIAPNGRNGRNGIAFYKMSNCSECTSLMYVVPDLEAPISDGSWAELRFGLFRPMGPAKVKIEEKDDSDFEKDEKRIKTKFNELDKNIPINSELLEQALICKGYLVELDCWRI